MSNPKKYVYDWIGMSVLSNHSARHALADRNLACGARGRQRRTNAECRHSSRALSPGSCLVWRALNVLRVLFGKISHFSPLDTTDTTSLALISTAIFVVYLIALPILGYHIMTILLLAVLFRLFGLSFIACTVGAIAASLGIAYVFEGLLNVVLPVGIFEIVVFS